MNYNQEQSEDTVPMQPSEDTVPMQPVSQFPAFSPIALRHYIAEMNRTQEELKERLRQQEQATRNAVGVGVLSVVLATASIAVTFCLRSAELRSNSPLVAERASNASATVLVSMR